MVVDRSGEAIRDHRMGDLPDLLRPGDLLVANDSRVLPARLRGRKVPSGGSVEVLLLRSHDATRWQALVRGRVRAGTRLRFEAAEDEAIDAVVSALLPDGTRELEFARPLEPVLARLGETPLPPYIREPLADPDRYQTVFARVDGSVAAPTAGLHFTPQLLDRLADRGVALATLTLHVGQDTFRPIESALIEDHVIHREWAVVPPDTLRRARQARRAGRRVVAVGTTSVRALETADAAAGESGAGFAGWTDLYIAPGYRFRLVDGLITNFHLPRTSLLVLVAALTGKELLDRAYEHAIAGGYRFYTFGDAMLVT
jgi:S-adenosylmethionine:tRNA ribosyltransferase-isomerase